MPELKRLKLTGKISRGQAAQNSLSLIEIANKEIIKARSKKKAQLKLSSKQITREVLRARKISPTSIKDLPLIIGTKWFRGADREQKDLSKQPHYTQFQIQPIVFCEVNKLGWCTSNIIKYVCRENLKNGLEDLKKARVYLDCLIQYKETGYFMPPEQLYKAPVMPLGASTMNDPTPIRGNL